MSDIQEAVGNINKIAQKLNTDVFKETTIANLNSTLSNMKEASSSFAETSRKIDGVVKKAEGAVETGQQTFVSAKGAADELKKTIADIRSVVQQTKQGRGTLGALLSDREMAENLKALVANLRRNGILWYKDRAQVRTP